MDMPRSAMVWLMSPDPAPPTQAQFKAVDQLTGGSARPRPQWFDVLVCSACAVRGD